MASFVDGSCSMQLHLQESGESIFARRQRQQQQQRQRPPFHRRGSTSTSSEGSTTSSSSSASSLDNDMDAITPCAPAVHDDGQQQSGLPEDRHVRHSLALAEERRESMSWRSSGSGSQDEMMTTAAATAEKVDAATLWRRMLAVQRVVGCYNSARMRAALDDDDDGVVPSRACLDLLNDSIDRLPDQSRRQLEAFLEHGASASLPSKKPWRRRLHGLNVFR